MLEDYIRQRLEQKEILLMTHIVIGYPSLKESYDIVESMVAAGVDLMELQIPFSEPIADGPVILRANQESLNRGVTIKDCMEFSQRITRDFEIPFLFMTYYNILYKFGVERFVNAMGENSIRGAIVPDLPPEEGADFLQAMTRQALAPIMIYSPTTPVDRMRLLASSGRGFVYCVARKGVTGLDTRFSEHLEEYLSRCRAATHLPLALGFGVKNREDIDFLRGKIDIAVIGTRTIQIVDENGTGAVKEFIEGLR